MGTDTKIKLRQEKEKLKKLCKCLGWSQAQLATQHFIYNNPSDNEDDIRKHINKVKKQLSRDSTSIDTIKGYIDFIRKHPDFINSDFVYPKNYMDGRFCDELEVSLKDISKYASEIVVNNSNASHNHHS